MIDAHRVIKSIASKFTAKRPPSSAMSRMSVSKPNKKDIFISYQWGIQDKVNDDNSLLYRPTTII